MKITAVEFFPLSLPLNAPFKAAWLPEPITSRNGTLVRVRTDEDITGFGWQRARGLEIKQVGESKLFKSLVVGLEIHEVEKVSKILQRFPIQMYAVEVAMWDALGKSAR